MKNKSLLCILLLSQPAQGQMVEWCKRYDTLREDERNFLLGMGSASLAYPTPEQIRQLEICRQMDRDVQDSPDNPIVATGRTGTISLAPLAALGPFTSLSVACSFEEYTRPDGELDNVSRSVSPHGLGALRSLRSLEILHVLFCGDISNWPFDAMTKLNYLLLHRTSMLQVPSGFINLTGLKTLILQNTSVSEIASLARMVALQTLILLDWSGEGELQDLTPLLSMYNLRELAIQGHPRMAHLQGIEFLANLTTLAVNQAKISSLHPLAGALWLERLNVNDNALETLAGVEHIPRLQVLDAANNQIHDLTALAGKKLKQLNLKSNAIRDVRALAHLLRQAEFPEIDLSENPVFVAAGLNAESDNPITPAMLEMMLQASR